MCRAAETSIACLAFFWNDRVPERTINRIVFKWHDALRDSLDVARAEHGRLRASVTAIVNGFMKAPLIKKGAGCLLK
jgi:hypothetical protein